METYRIIPSKKEKQRKKTLKILRINQDTQYFHSKFNKINYFIELTILYYVFFILYYSNFYFVYFMLLILFSSFI